ncbi:N-alpha-acetyltransferase 60 isoform X2 [Heterocephalus glaber]|uniref:N-alpha-acetyltransferase 60 n=1 Tax=Heterocephalus glaber TaxID=10181 RepID=A0AAX6Q4H4_HETGA|nr:N-alpha-acetyltransferase 60 isoform X2 [Heterocephalus glaber]
MTEVVLSSALSEVSLRLLCHDDIDTVKHLCSDWFPIEYPDSWYRDITSNKKFFSLAATYRGAIVGMIVAEIKSRTKIHKEDGDILASNFSVDTQVAYILSLGVVKEFRKHGIGSTAKPTACCAASFHGQASPPRAASSTAAPCDASGAASTRPHTLPPYRAHRAHLPLHLTSPLRKELAATCWPIGLPQLQARCYMGSGAEHASSLQQAPWLSSLLLETSAST